MIRALAICALLLGAAAARAAEGPDALAALSAHPGGLTADEVARRAAATSLDARAKLDDVKAAAAQVDQAIAALFPRLQGSARYVRLSPVDMPSLGTLIVAPPGAPTGVPLPPSTPLFAYPLTFPIPLDNTTLQATLSLPLSDYLLRLVQGLAAAKYSVEAARLTERAARLKAAADGRALFYGWARARGQVAVAVQALGQARAHLADVNVLYQQGMVSKADVLRVDSQVAATELLVERARGFVAVMGEQLHVVMHDGSGPLELGEDVASRLPPDPAAPLDDLVREAESARFEVKAVRALHRTIAETVRLSRAGYYPRLDAFGEVDYQNPNQRIFPLQDKFLETWDVGVQLSWAPNDAGFAWASVKQAQSKLDQVEAQQAGILDGLRIELSQAQQAAREAALADEVSTRGLASAEESYRERRELFKNGRATSVELSDAEADLTRARLEAVNARVDLRIARVKLEHATGRDARD